MQINGYRIEFNSFWDEWQVSHDVVGMESFNNFNDAEEYVQKG